MAISNESACALLLAAAVALLPARADAQAVQGGALPGPLPLFPASNWWNVDVTSAPVDANSAAFITWIGAGRGMHPDFGGDSSPAPSTYGMPYVVVPGTQPLVPVAFFYASESDAGAPGRPIGYPIPVEAKTQPRWIEGGYPGNCDAAPALSPCRGDSHMLIVDKDHRLLFETWQTRCLPANSATCTWSAGSGAVFSLDSNARRTDGWTSADAAGLAILPGLVRYDEVAAPGPILHAFRFTLTQTNGYVFPASHVAGSTPGAPPMGTRLRLKAATDLSSYPASAQKIFQAMKTYGLILADNGSDMYVQGTYDTLWDNGILNPAFGAIHAGDFEVVQLGWKPTVPTNSGPTSFYTVTPCRIADTRNAAGPYGGPAIQPGSQRIFTVTGLCGVPAAAKAISGIVTAVTPSSDGAFRMFSGDEQPDVATAISFASGKTRSNNVVLKLAGDGSGSLGVSSTATGSVHLVIDVNGYFP